MTRVDFEELTKKQIAAVVLVVFVIMVVQVYFIRHIRNTRAEIEEAGGRASSQRGSSTLRLMRSRDIRQAST
jgi:hypothetical protein